MVVIYPFPAYSFALEASAAARRLEPDLVGPEGARAGWLRLRIGILSLSDSNAIDWQHLQVV